MSVLQRIVQVSQSEDGEGPPGQSCVQKAYDNLRAKEDKKNGGFGSSPKFPQPGMFSVLGYSTRLLNLIYKKYEAVTCYVSFSYPQLPSEILLTLHWIRNGTGCSGHCFILPACHEQGGYS